MNILFDLISTQDFVNGGGEYTKTVFLRLCEKNAGSNNQVFGFFDSKRRFAFDDFQKNQIENLSNVTLVDINGTSINELVRRYHIDKVFIGIAQKIAKCSNFEPLECPVICVIHDMAHQETQNVGLPMFLQQDNFKEYTKQFLLKHLFEEKRHVNKDMTHLIDSVLKSEGCFITVSDYSKNSIEYLTKIPSNKISVLYSPLKKNEVKSTIENTVLKTLIGENEKYLLAVSANRPLKNVQKAINAYKRLAEKEDCGVKFVTVGYKGKSACPGHVILPYLSESDLEYAYMNCYGFVYTSLLEGFGYPPVEAMKFGKAVLSSNVCSMPEILGRAAIYASPYYEVDIYRALKMLVNEESNKEFSALSKARYASIEDRQNKDLEKLIDKILN